MHNPSSSLRGVAARLQEMAPFLDWRSRGGSYPTQTTPAAPAKVLRDIFLGRGHPSLEKREMAHDSKLIHNPYDRAFYSLRFEMIRVRSLKNGRS